MGTAALGCPPGEARLLTRATHASDPLGKTTQNDFHGLIGTAKATGWSNQIQHEIGGMISYERFYRVPLIGDDTNGVDVVPQAGATLGNLMTYGDIGGMIRIGKNLGADYGPTHVRPSLSGADYFNADHLDGKLGFYVFFGAQGRAVGHNIFLDGNTFRQSPHVNKKILLRDPRDSGPRGSFARSHAVLQR